MKYVVLGDDAKEYGPIDGETLRKWVESGRVLPDTQVRNALLKNKWCNASSIDFLDQAFVVLKDRNHEETSLVDRLRGMFSLVKSKSEENPSKKSTFRHVYVPQPASLILRTCAGVTDLLLMGLLAVFFMGMFWVAVHGGCEPNSAWRWLVAGYLGGALSYYGLTLGCYAQTGGMWFWGIMLAKAGKEANELEEAYLLRAYCFALGMLLFGIFSPLSILLTPRRRAVHDLLTGCVVVGIAARPKA